LYCYNVKTLKTLLHVAGVVLDQFGGAEVSTLHEIISKLEKLSPKFIFFFYFLGTC